MKSEEEEINLLNDAFFASWKKLNKLFPNFGYSSQITAKDWWSLLLFHSFSFSIDKLLQQNQQIKSDNKYEKEKEVKERKEKEKMMERFAPSAEIFEYIYNTFSDFDECWHIFPDVIPSLRVLFLLHITPYLLNIKSIIKLSSLLYL